MNTETNSTILNTSSNNTGILRIILNNPLKQNVLSDEMMTKIQEALDHSILDNKTRVIIISANGPIFSAGHDLKQLKEARQNSDKGKKYFKKILQKCSKLMQTIINNHINESVNLHMIDVSEKNTTTRVPEALATLVVIFLSLTSIM